VDEEHCVTATVTDASGDPTPGIDVVFMVHGAHPGQGSDTTDGSGQATFCYQGELFGTDEITAFADFDPENGTRDAGEPSDLARKRWRLPRGACSVKIANSGSIIAANGDRATFDGHASQHAGSRRASGHQHYRDHGPAQSLAVRSKELLAIACRGMAASIFGIARTSAGPWRSFRIDVEDGGRQNPTGDTYRMLLETGYDSGVQPLQRGYIKIKQR
jgi:hypothetical protein